MCGGIGEEEKRRAKKKKKKSNTKGTINSHNKAKKEAES